MAAAGEAAGVGTVAEGVSSGGVLLVASVVEPCSEVMLLYVAQEQESGLQLEIKPPRARTVRFGAGRPLRACTEV